ncbi:MAG: class I SAM-dependent rRNA methyltransferase [Pseudohongiellaceae bacterium]
MKEIRLRRGRDSSLRRLHPWVFSGALGEPAGDSPASGETVRVLDAAGNALALAAWSPQSRIRARVWSFDPSESINEAFFQRRLEEAMARRGERATAPNGACRLVHGESDGLPGLIVDRYDNVLVCQCLSAGAEAWKEEIADALMSLLPADCLYERSDAGIRELEGLSPVKGILRGALPDTEPHIVENGAGYTVDVVEGHKTGFYLDQSANRALARREAKGRRVLNCFSYTGAFSVAALQGGASHVTNVDASEPALERAAAHMALNGFDKGQYSNLCANAFQQLRRFREDERQFDLIILDPPKFADSRNQLKKGARAYKDIALQAAYLLSPGGLLMTFSCSGAMDMGLFQKITADALLDAGRFGQVQAWLYQGADHPVSLPFPESLYLKGLLCRLD